MTRAQAVKRALLEASPEYSVGRGTDAPFEQIGASWIKGGELAPTTMDMLPPAYGAALKDARTGGLVGPFKTDAGWVVARIDDRRPEAPITLEVAKPQIIRFLTYDQVKDLILNLRRHAKVEMLTAPLRAAPGTSAEPASAPAAPAAKP